MLDEEERQLLLLALAKLALKRPGWDEALGVIAEKLAGKREYESLKKF